jgi:hypothetical protein
LVCLEIQFVLKSCRDLCEFLNWLTRNEFFATDVPWSLKSQLSASLVHKLEVLEHIPYTICIIVGQTPNIML